MKLFQNLFGKGAIEIGAPAEGKCVSIKSVSDPTFADEILGKGIAIIPEKNQFYAPADGVISTVFPTGHAVALTTDEGIEILVHIGIDTVKLNGTHFTIHVKDEQRVTKGDLMIEADLEGIKEQGYEIITPVVICNSLDFSEINELIDKNVSHGDPVLTIKK